MRFAAPALLMVLALSMAKWSAALAEGRDDARLSRAVIRCTRFAELIACGEALSLRPNSPDLLVAEADALMQLKRPGEAIGVYRNSLTVGANRDAVNARVLTAQSLRASLLRSCVTQEGPFAERSCASAWLPGAPDEVTVFKRRGFLLQGQNEPGAALDAYLAAARLAPKDRGVARALIGLSDSTGRRDAMTLTAVGTALMTLGRAADAIAPLRQAIRLMPDLAVAKDRLRAAERAAAAAAEAARITEATSYAEAGIDATRVASGATFSNEAEVTRSN